MAMKGGNPQNLRPKPWKKGQSGNPAGRPKDPIALQLRKLVRCKDYVKPKTLGDKVAQGIMEEAIAKRYPFVATLLDRTEGRIQPTEPTALIEIDEALRIVDEALAVENTDNSDRKALPSLAPEPG